MSSTSTTPKRTSTRARTAQGRTTSDASSPYRASSGPLRLPNSVRKSSRGSLSQSPSLASIPDAGEAVRLRTVLVESPTAARMNRRASNVGGIEVGDLVDVPGNMHGVVKFVGSVAGKKGIFAGVELSEEFAARGKNSGDVDGVSYFVTSAPGAGIFLPSGKAMRRDSAVTSLGSFPLTPTTPGADNSRIGSSKLFTPTRSMSSFSKSVGPGRASSPLRPSRRPSLPRPESPVRRLQSTTPVPQRPSMGTPNFKTSVMRVQPSPTPGNFSQSVRGARDAGDPSKSPTKRMGLTPRSGTPRLGGLKASVGPRAASSLSQGPNFDDDDATFMGITRSLTKDSLSSLTSINGRVTSAEARVNAEEIARLTKQLEQRDGQLKDQASALADMENSFQELQALMQGGGAARSIAEDKDASHLRMLLREKSEKIAFLTSEFDAHRADFRSTIDTLEMASTETERVYEQRVQDLLRDLQEYQDRTEDVDNVASQLRQLEELVQELEEGLEDARRGEAEARGEVEFLRGEVERGRSELKREREKAAFQQGGDASSLAKDVEQRDDEIRGLKAIIHSLSRDANQGATDLQRGSVDAKSQKSQEQLQRQLAELKLVIEAKATREEELEQELEALRRGSMSLPPNPQRASGMSNLTIVQNGPNASDTRNSVSSWRERDLPRIPEPGRRLDSMPESDSYSSATDNSTLWCEICETGGHDILTCSSVFASKPTDGDDINDYAVKHTPESPQRTNRMAAASSFSPKALGDAMKPVGLQTPKKAPPAPALNINDFGPVAGKESGIVDPERWCALCERDGHESVDCPFDDMI